ncbi:hypothetical protein [Lacimicrobium alkaliphilum]|uniref:Extradiol ring-cleavage dioxygenase LigAB LigA subunit domain-containing protein n=1 Tax=Lacimicrobium alkaliphilum TaxID=1526571 RepID=A0A0U2JIP3_9ALTE|nr:hypothetical protein [Lacimicrobium alkaliphilum]ALS97990.1 hypothetical protein AT746_06740 [Lacimicrobium alkaliphilum]
MTTLAQFIQELATDATLHQAYADDAVQTMQNYGLSASEIDAVTSGDKDAIEQLTGKTVKPVTFFHPVK